jgi:acrylyl-CoA reductase (NADPH)
MSEDFKAILIRDESATERSVLAQLQQTSLAEGDVLVTVRYSTLNYKDCLAITGRAPVVRKYPMVPGIDFVGTVLESASDSFKPGDWVILNGWGVGEKHWGGLAQMARVRSEWLVRLPTGILPQQAMALGTAGYTAMLCVMALQRQGVKPSDGPIAVSGASGGVGSVAIMLLAGLGFEVSAITGRTKEAPYLHQLGANNVLDRAEFTQPGKPLMKERWAGVVDTVGSQLLSNLCASTTYGGVVTACGLAGGMDFPSTVAPFILRGVSLLGIDSVMCPLVNRIEAWNRLASEIDTEKLNLMSRVIGLKEALLVAPELLDGQVRGRVVVDVNH